LAVLPTKGKINNSKVKAKNLKMICIVTASALSLTVNVRAQDKMTKDTSKKNVQDGT
jgi:hypothetical protein